MKARDVITIDGPAGSGKSTVAKELARRLGWLVMDTGLMYRGVTWFLLEKGMDPKDEEGVRNLLKEMEITLNDKGELKINGILLSDRELKNPEVDSNVSLVASYSFVRDCLRRVQRRFADRGPLVAEGRDMGTVVFPNAKWKFYLDADIGERARRRKKDYLAKGIEKSIPDLEREVRERDKYDMERMDGPLSRPKDAVFIDTTNLSFREVVERILEKIKTHKEER